MGNADIYFFKWVELPLRLFGDYIWEIQSFHSVPVMAFMREIESVWLELIPDFELRLIRYIGILRTQCRAVEKIQSYAAYSVWSCAGFAAVLFLKSERLLDEMKDFRFVMQHLHNGTHHV